jgi:hypothetical protein
MILFYILAGLAVFIGGTIAIQKYQLFNTSPRTSANNSPTSNPIPILPMNHDTSLVNDNFALPPGYIKTVNFHVRGSGTVTGRFKAHGGIDDAIRVIITNQDGYTNYQKNNSYRAWYNSGEVAVENVNATLGPGDYILLVSNTGSLTNRTIQADIKLSDFY